MIDNDPAVIQQLNQHISTLQTNAGETQRANTLQYLDSKSDKTQFDIFFLDPPFGKELIAPTIEG